MLGLYITYVLFTIYLVCMQLIPNYNCFARRFGSNIPDQNLALNKLYSTLALLPACLSDNNFYGISCSIA
jgi:hypothetical protein